LVNVDKVIFFDAGPIISLVMSRLIWILPKLKEEYPGKFYITPAVKKELVERPMNIRRFEFEALQVTKLIEDGVLEVYDKVPQKIVDKLKTLANSSFKIGKNNMDVLQAGELESLACYLDVGGEAIVIDERTLRLFIENSKNLRRLLEKRFRSKVVADLEQIDRFKKEVGVVKIIRSVELVGVAYKFGWLDSYIPKKKGGREVLLDSVLWAAKSNGSAVTGHEIEEIKNYLLS
jgi:hypothetical protein